MGNTVDQMQAAIGNNQDLIERYGNNYGDLLTGLTTDFQGTILSTITGVSDLSALATQSASGANTMMNRLLSSYLQSYKEKSQALEAVGLTPQSTAEVMDDLGNRSEEAMDKVTKAVNKSTDAFSDLIQEVDKLLSVDSNDLDDLISKFENLATQITTLIKESGEFTETIGRVKIDGRIDDWEDLQEIYESLAKNGEIMLKYYDENGNESILDLLSGNTDTNNTLSTWRQAILGDWDNESWTGRGFDKDKAKTLSKMDKGDATKIRNYYQDLLDEINYQVLDRLQVSDTLYQKLKDKGINFETEDAANKRATILFDAANNAEETNNILDAIKEIMEEQLKVTVSGYGGEWYGKKKDDGNNNGWYTPSYILADRGNYVNTRTNEYGVKSARISAGGGHYVDLTNGYYYDTGGYTGRWQSVYADTGLYTGEWPNGSVRANGRLAWLHQKELVLNAHDTENFLDAMEIVRQLDNLTNWMANGLGSLTPVNVATESDTLEQNVHIEASFPNVTNHSEIEQAFENIVNLASQYANRK